MWCLGCGLAVGLAACILLGGPEATPTTRGRPVRPLGAVLGALRSLPAARRAEAREASARRSAACERQMPEMLDILALGLTAGLSFDASLELYCDRGKTELSEELRMAMRAWQMGLDGRREALLVMAERVGSSSVSKFCSAVCEALSFGAPLAQTLERQADSLREEQRSSVQQRIEEVPVRMLVPLGTLVVPAMLLAILGPLLCAAFAG